MKLAFIGSLLFVHYGLTATVNIVYVYVPKLKTWNSAQEYCKTYHTGMAFIQSEADHQMLQEAAGGTFSQAWIGLYRQNGNTTSWLWSGRHTYIFSKLNSENNVNYNCGYATPLEWRNDLCSVKRIFFCYDNFDLTLVKVSKTWEDALEYCRSHYSELAGATSQFQFSLLSAKDQNSTTTAVWIGLRFLAGQWIWVSKSFRHEDFKGSLNTCPADPYYCGAHNKVTGQLENKDCNQKLNFVCY